MSYRSDMSLPELLASFEAEGKRVCEALGVLDGGSGQGSTIGQAYWWLCETLKGAVREAPFQKGDRVELIETPDLSDAPGWRHSKHFLVKDARATVARVSLERRGWTVMLQFDDDSYMPDWGEDKSKIFKTPPGERSHYCFAARKVRRLSRTEAAEDQ